MRTVTFLSVLHGAARLCGISDPANELNSARAADLTEYLNERFREAWEFQWWSEWTILEQRRYAQKYDASITYPVQSWVWYEPTQKYYYAVVTHTGGSGTAPATLSGTTYTANEDAWVEAATAWPGSSDWYTSTAYVVGDVVRRPSDNSYYHCHTAHTSAGSDLNTFNFTKLTPFVRLVPWSQTEDNGSTSLTEIGRVQYVAENNPEVATANLATFDHKPTADGTLVAKDAPDEPWVSFQKPAPQFTFTSYAAATAYVVGDTVYYSTTGECYECIQAGTGNLPTDTAYWTKIDFPRVISGFVKRAVKADVQNDQGQTRAARNTLGLAYDELNEAAERDQAFQSQYDSVDYGGFN